MKTKIFIGGWMNTGTRIICDLLRLKGYEIIDSQANQVYDFLGTYFRELFKNYLYYNNFEIFNTIEQYIDNYQNKPWVIKHGMLMRMIPELKKRFPDLIFILCIRHPIDIFLKNNDQTYKDFFNIKDPTLNDKYNCFKQWYDLALLDADYIIKLEDLLFNSKDTIYDLYRYLECDLEVSKDILNIIKPPSDTVGVWKTVFKDIEYQDIIKYSTKFGY